MGNFAAVEVLNLIFIKLYEEDFVIIP